jgi:hypothetical protein
MNALDKISTLIDHVVFRRLDIGEASLRRPG